MILTTYSGDVIFLLKPCKINDRRKANNIECRCGILPLAEIFVFPCLFLRTDRFRFTECICKGSGLV